MRTSKIYRVLLVKQWGIDLRWRHWASMSIRPGFLLWYGSLRSIPPEGDIIGPHNWSGILWEWHLPIDRLIWRSVTFSVPRPFHRWLGSFRRVNYPCGILTKNWMHETVKPKDPFHGVDPTMIIATFIGSYEDPRSIYAKLDDGRNLSAKRDKLDEWYRLRELVRGKFPDFNP